MLWEHIQDQDRNVYKLDEKPKEKKKKETSAVHQWGKKCLSCLLLTAQPVLCWISA